MSERTVLNPSNVLAFASPADPFQNKVEYFDDEAAQQSPLQPTHLELTPLRAHYLKRELVSLQLRSELSDLAYPDALSIIGPPFGPAPSTDVAYPVRQAKEIDLPFIRFFFHHFVLTLPMLAKAPPNFFKDKLQPFVHSFLTRNISTSEFRGEETKRDRFADKIEKHLGLIFSSATRLSDNEGQEHVVRVTDRPTQASTSRPSGAPSRSLPPLPPGVKESPFLVNIVTVRHILVKGRIRNSTREEFIIKTSLKGHTDVFVSRRYGDFVKLAEQLRREFPEEDVRPPPAKDRTSVVNKASRGSGSPQMPASPTGSFDSEQQISLAAVDQPLTLARERNRLTLRAYLRHILSQPVIASSETLRQFLLDKPTSLSEAEQHDIGAREEMDRVREAEVARFKKEVEERVKDLEVHLKAFKEELVKKDGLTRVFATVRRTPDINDLPLEYKKLIEWARISLASTVYQLFAGSDNSSSNFNQLKRLHGLMPYFMLRGILRISNPVAMIRAFLDLFLARPFGQNSLLQRMFSSGLQEEVRELQEDLILVADKINRPAMVAKVQAFITAPKEIQNMFQEDARQEKVDLMTVILRSAEEPPLTTQDMMQVQRSNHAYSQYLLNKEKSGEDDYAPENDDAWLYEDLHVLLRIAQRARDKEQLIELIFEGGTSELLKDIVTIFYQPLAQVYRAANIADSLSDLQTFIADLIKTVEAAEDASVQNPETTVQTFIDLVGRHEPAFYRFVYQVHSKGSGLFDELMHWIELFINLVREGFPDVISLEYLLPHKNNDRQEIMKEVDALVEYHRQLKVAHHQRMQRRLVRGSASQAEKNEDSAFVQGVMQNLNLGNVNEDVAALAAEDSEEEAEGESSDEEIFEDAQQSVQPEDTLHASKPLKSRKDRVMITAPHLKHIPKLVPVFKELMRPNLQQVRSARPSIVV